MKNIAKLNLDKSAGLDFAERLKVDSGIQKQFRTIPRYIYMSFSSTRVIFIECKRENGNYVLVTNATTRRALIDHPISV